MGSFQVTPTDSNATFRTLEVRDRGKTLTNFRKRRIHMGTKMVRLVDDYTLLDFAGGMSEEEADRHRELLEESEKRAKKSREELLERIGIDE